MVYSRLGSNVFRGIIMDNMIKVIVADDNDITRQMIVDCLSDDEQIEVVGQAADGREAINLIKLYEPDVVLLDLVMPMADGIGVMETVAEETQGAKKPHYIIVSAAGSEDIVNQALQTGASYFIMKPFDGEALIKRVKKMGAGQSSAIYAAIQASPDIEQMVVDILRDVGVSLRMVGYKYLKEAIILAINDSDCLTSVTKYIYPAVANHFGSAPNNVERNIRYAIESAWEKRNEIKYLEFQNGLFMDKDKKPTNSEFINFCAERIQYRNKN